MKYLCKKTYLLKNSPDTIIFRKGMWYIENLKFAITGDDTFFYSLNLHDYAPYFTINELELNEHFYTIQELRELEIDKILNT